MIRYRFAGNTRILSLCNEKAFLSKMDSIYALSALKNHGFYIGEDIEAISQIGYVISDGICLHATGIY